jgi:hypothetical protein
MFGNVSKSCNFLLGNQYDSSFPPLALFHFPGRPSKKKNIKILDDLDTPPTAAAASPPRSPVSHLSFVRGRKKILLK